MRKSMTLAAGIAALVLGTGVPRIAEAVDVNINVGPPQQVVVVREQPAPQPRFVVYEKPTFLFTPPLGYYVSVDSPYDIIRYGSRYYIYNDGRWFRSSSYRGPWKVVEYRYLPVKIRKHRYTEICRYRDVEFRKYKNNRGHGKGRWH